MNHLEQLVGEWYEFQGYFLRRNVKVAKRLAGGYEGELDVVAFNPQTEHLVHIEASLDALSWADREVRFGRKFELGKEHVPSLFEGLDLPTEIDQVALLAYASKKNRDSVGGGRIMLVGELMADIFAELKSLQFSLDAIPETLPLLRTLQLVAEHRAGIIPMLSSH